MKPHTEYLTASGPITQHTMFSLQQITSPANKQEEPQSEETKQAPEQGSDRAQNLELSDKKVFKIKIRSDSGTIG